MATGHMEDWSVKLMANRNGVNGKGTFAYLDAVGREGGIDIRPPALERKRSFSRPPLEELGDRKGIVDRRKRMPLPVRREGYSVSPSRRILGGYAVDITAEGGREIASGLKVRRWWWKGAEDAVTGRRLELRVERERGVHSLPRDMIILAVKEETK